MGCRNRFPKGDLIRVVRSPEGVISIDVRGKAQGRGVYICRDANCFKRVRKNRAMERLLKSQIPDGAIIEIERLLTDDAT
jgi:hypothetical protein